MVSPRPRRRARVLRSVSSLSACGGGRGRANDKYHGTGTLSQRTGEVYSGEWRNGMRHGVGTLTLQDGSTQSGEWEYDHFAPPPLPPAASS